MRAGTIKSIMLASTAVVFATSCDSSRITAPAKPDVTAHTDSASNLLGLFGPRLLACPSSQTLTTTAEVGLLGGIVSIGGTSISIPLGALLEPVTVIVTVPASNYMEIDISVEGANTFLFQLPVVVTINYSRCTSLRALLIPLTAWHIDSDTKKLLAPMPSLDNKLTRTVTFTTDHLTGYALAN